MQSSSWTEEQYEETFTAYPWCCGYLRSALHYVFMPSIQLYSYILANYFIFHKLFRISLILNMFVTVRINLPLFSNVPSNVCMFLSCRPFVVITLLSTGLVGVEV